MSHPILPNGKTQKQVATPNRPALLPAAIYARVSTEDQGKGYSIPTQIEACQRLAQQESYSVPESHIFIDEGISGTTLDRPALRRLRDLVATQAIAAVIILDPDRLSRKMGKLLVLTDELQAANIPLLCVSHPVESGPEGMLFFQMRGVIAEYEREKALERMHRGKIGRVKSGYYGGGAIPYGYTYIPEAHKGTIVINEGEAATVRRIFAMYCEGRSIHAIAIQLTQEGIIPKRASGPRKWRNSSIHAILHNVTYATGIMLWNKRRYISGKITHTRDRTECWEIPVPPILSQEVFEAAQQQSQRNIRFSPRNRKYEYLFTGGRLRCGRCGGSMSGYAPPNRAPRYRCSSQFTHHPDEPFCRGAIRVERIEPLVWQAIERALSDPTLIMAELERREHEQATTTRDMTKERQVIEKALAALEREAQRWDEAYAHEVIDIAELKAKKLDINDRKQRMLAQQEAVESSMLAAQQSQAKARDILLYCQQVQERLHTLDVPHKRQALEALGIRVTWASDEPIQIAGSIPMDAIISNAPRCTGSSPNMGLVICVA